MARLAVSGVGAREMRSIGSERITLGDNRQVWIRALGEADEQPIRELLTRLDPVSWYFRFLSPYGTAIDALVSLMLRITGDRGLTLVAELPADGSPQIVGIANLAVTNDAQAELGLVIRGDWQRQGLGTALAARLLTAAERRGITRCVAHVLSRNVAARRLLAKIGTVGVVRFCGRVSEYWFTPCGNEAADRNRAADEVCRPPA